MTDHSTTDPTTDDARPDLENAPDATVGGPPRHLPTDERNRDNPESAIPRNPDADTAYGAVRGLDPAHPDASS